ncbi:protein kinase [bacterium]|nr:protein kinase [bacterium]
MIGRTIGHYRILEKIGSGGMGDVYRAEDLRLGRDVAVKALPDSLATDPAALARFQREARAVAALSHPNTAAIHDLVLENDAPFAIMELLQGETLRGVLRRRGAIPAQEAVAWAVQIASGIGAAHAKGIVHRDLKPEHVFVSPEGRLKILDFGLAKRTDPSPLAVDGPTLAETTSPGTILGTISYMAPEQLRGEDVDPRADLFAFGIVLHEIVTGTHPFRRASPAETASAILRDEPPPLREGAPGLPDELGALVGHCLRKNRADRPASAAEVLMRLEHAAGSPPAAAAPGAAIDSLAVLPFLNESGREDTDYLVDGLADMLIDNLSQLPRLKVMARSTVLRYRDRDVSPGDVGHELGVRAVLTGRLQERRDTLVIRAELVDASDGTRLWGARFDRPRADLLAIEDEIAREISDRLRFELTTEERVRLTKRHTENPEAHEAYLQGRFVWNRWKTPEGMRTAIGFFERALELDPLYARAFAGLADSHSVLGNVKALPPQEAYPNAKNAALQGLAIDDTLAELHTSLGFIQRNWDWDWNGADASFRRAIECNPGYATGHRWYAGLLSILGRHEEAVERAKHALDLDPLSLIIHTAVGDVLYYAGRNEESMEYYRRSIDMDPNFLPGHTDLARALEQAGRYEEAIAEFRRAEALAPKGPPEPSSGLAHVYARMGRRDDALVIVDRLVEMSRTRYVSPYGLGSIHACLGDTDTALDWLERAFDEHDQTLVLLKVHPRLERIREHPRCRELLRKMRL